MADDRTPPLDDDEDDWDSEWEDDDVDNPTPGPASASTPAAAPSRATPEPPTAPAYDDSLADDDDDVLLPPSPSEVIHERNQQRQPARAPRVRPAGVAAPAAREKPAPDSDDDVQDPKPASNRNSRGCVLALILGISVFVVAVAMIMLAFGGFGSLLGGSGDDPADPLPGVPMSSSAPTSAQPENDDPATVAQVVEEECVPSGDEEVTVGNGRGDQKTGEGVILAFDYAYYVERSGRAARGFMSDTIKETTADTLQGAIDKLPQGAAHCLTITPDRPNVYKVKLAEYVPDGDEVIKSVYDQEITVDKVDDRFVIVGVVNG